MMCIMRLLCYLHTILSLRRFFLHPAGRMQNSGSCTPWYHTYTKTLHYASLDCLSCSTGTLSVLRQVSSWETAVWQHSNSSLTCTWLTGIKNGKRICCGQMTASPWHTACLFINTSALQLLIPLRAWKDWITLMKTMSHATPLKLSENQNNATFFFPFGNTRSNKRWWFPHVNYQTTLHILHGTLNLLMCSFFGMISNWALCILLALNCNDEMYSLRDIKSTVPILIWCDFYLMVIFIIYFF